MIKIYKEIYINASKDEVWEVIKDFPTVMNYHPLINNSYSINNTSHSGVGAERTCEFDAKGTKFIHERVVRYDEGESYDVDIYGGNQIPPINDMLATIGIKSASASQTILWMQISYSPRVNPLMWIMAHTMIKKFMNNAIDGIVRGAKHHIETGAMVSSFKDIAMIPAVA